MYLSLFNLLLPTMSLWLCRTCMSKSSDASMLPCLVMSTVRRLSFRKSGFLDPSSATTQLITSYSNMRGAKLTPKVVRGQGSKYTDDN